MLTTTAVAAVGRARKPQRRSAAAPQRRSAAAPQRRCDTSNQHLFHPDGLVAYLILKFVFASTLPLPAFRFTFHQHRLHTCFIQADSTSSRAPIGVPLILKELVGSVQLVAWAEANGCPCAFVCRFGRALWRRCSGRGSTTTRGTR